MKKILSLLLAVAFLSSSPAIAAADKFKFDTAHTQVMFSVSHMGFSFSHGRFLKFDGSFTFDEEKPETSTVEMTIDTTGIDMGLKAWDDHLKGADFFNVEKFPSMTFKTTKVEKTGEKTGKVTGDLTLLGVTKPVTLDVTYNGSGIHPYSKSYVAGFSGVGTLKRSDFGMTYGLPGVGDDVTLKIEVEGVRQDFTEPPK